MSEPIKRHEALQPLSREHHQGLLLAMKVGKGLKKGVALNRIKKYVDWFFSHYLKSHFEAEEKYAFPILGDDHPGIQQALEEHRKIEAFVKSPMHGIQEEQLIEFKQLLEGHIRLEERQLFNEIQEKATAEELQKLEEVLSEEDFCLTWTDEFWK